MTMTGKFQGVGRIILIWVIANFLGVAAIGASTLFFPLLMSIPIPGWLLSSLMIGLPIGIAQWIALRRVAPISILWVLTIAAGLTLGLMVRTRLPDVEIMGLVDDESVLLLTTGYTISGLLVGLIQWLFLCGHFTKSWVWVLGDGVGLGLGTGLVLATNLIDHGILSIILVTLVYAIVTGLVISWLSASHRKTGSNAVDAT